jgi:hypothetical protein
MHNSICLEFTISWFLPDILEKNVGSSKNCPNRTTSSLILPIKKKLNSDKLGIFMAVNVFFQLLKL